MSRSLVRMARIPLAKNGNVKPTLAKMNRCHCATKIRTQVLTAIYLQAITARANAHDQQKRQLKENAKNFERKNYTKAKTYRAFWSHCEYYRRTAVGLSSSANLFDMVLMLLSIFISYSSWTAEIRIDIGKFRITNQTQLRLEFRISSCLVFIHIHFENEDIGNWHHIKLYHKSNQFA